MKRNLQEVEEAKKRAKAELSRRQKLLENDPEKYWSEDDYGDTQTLEALLMKPLPCLKMYYPDASELEAMTETDQNRNGQKQDTLKTLKAHLPPNTYKRVAYLVLLLRDSFTEMREEQLFRKDVNRQEYEAKIMDIKRLPSYFLSSEKQELINVIRRSYPLSAVYDLMQEPEMGRPRKHARDVPLYCIYHAISPYFESRVRGKKAEIGKNRLEIIAEIVESFVGDEKVYGDLLARHTEHNARHVLSKAINRGRKLLTTAMV